MNGEWPPHQIDHKNTIRSDNRWDNLRPATHSQNVQNQRCAQAHNKSGLLGVCLQQGRWRAQITVDGKNRHLGRFSTAHEAYAAYVEAKSKAHPFQTIVEVA